VSRVFYGARLHVRRPGSPACPDHRVQVDAEITVPVDTAPDGYHVRADAYRKAEEVFREMLGAVMDLDGVRVDIEVWLW